MIAGALRPPRKLTIAVLSGAAVLLLCRFAAAQTAGGPAEQLQEISPPRVSARAEFRERMESLAGSGFATGRNDAYWLSRLRLSLTARPVPWLMLTGQLQDARVAGKDIGGAGPPFSAPIDVRLAQVEFQAAASPLSLTVGRQELAFGEQRLVGHVSWANAARTFDALRATLRRPGIRIDGFLSSVVRIRTDTWDRAGFGNVFHGVYGSTTRVVPGATLDPYFLWRGARDLRTEAGVPGDLALGTVGVRLAGVLPNGLEYGTETVFQRGTLGTDTQRAWAQHVRLRSRDLARGIRLVSEYNYASGDRNPQDGRRETFDVLYPTPHDKYGLADQVGWRNIHHVRSAASLTTTARLPLTVAYHSWWLASATDALYSAPGAVIARIPTGTPSRHVGQSIDVSGAAAIGENLQVGAGYAYIHPGGFLRAATPGARFNLVYLMVTVGVTAER